MFLFGFISPSPFTKPACLLFHISMKCILPTLVFSLFILAIVPFAMSSSSLSVGGIKSQLKLMGVSFADCIEKSDLMARLSEGYAKHFGKSYVVEPRGKHTATVIFAHGLGDSGAGWTDVMQHFAASMPHVKFLCPTASSIPVTLNMGMTMPAWYDIYGLTPDAKEDVERIQLAARFVQHLADKEASVVGHNRIVIGGFSQGSAVSLFAGLTSSENLAGVVSMSGYLPARDVLPSMVTDVGRAVPILMCHGEADPVVPMSMGSTSAQAIKNVVMNPNVDWKQYPGMRHEASPAEISDITAFLKRVIP
eukprot:PhM_4_TR10337/c0_g1_i1/m.36260/K06130/LYPLA2; lysophospholipase II